VLLENTAKNAPRYMTNAWTKDADGNKVLRRVNEKTHCLALVNGTVQVVNRANLVEVK